MKDHWVPRLCAGIAVFHVIGSAWLLSWEPDPTPPCDGFACGVGVGVGNAVGEAFTSFFGGLLAVMAVVALVGLIPRTVGLVFAVLSGVGAVVLGGIFGIGGWWGRLIGLALGIWLFTQVRSSIPYYRKPVEVAPEGTA